MLLSSGVMSLWFMGGGFGMMSGFSGMMGGMMGGIGAPLGFMMLLPLIGIASGVLVVTGAILLNSRSSEHTTWGTIILVFSIVSFLGMGGFLIGAILGIIGGALSVSWTPPST